MDNEEKIIREIEKKVDDVQRRKDIWGEDRAKLIYNSLICFEDLSRIEIPFLIYMREDINGAINSNADKIDMVIKWIFEYSKNIGNSFDRNVSENLYLELGKLLVDDSVKYRAICDSYTLWSRGKAEAKLYRANKAVEFNYLRDNDGSIEVYDLIRGNNKKNQELENLNITKEQNDAINNIVTTIEVDGDNHISYKIGDNEWTCIFNKLSSLTATRWSLPGEWEFNGFTLSNFRNFFNVILTKAFIHSLVCLKHGSNGAAVNDCVIVCTIDEIVNMVKKYSELTDDKIKIIIDLLTYTDEYFNKKIDVIWSPLILLNSDLIAISPNLILTSNPERNLISLINKVMPDSYSKLSVEKESIMIEDISNIFSAYNNVDLRSNRPLPEELPDMDIIMFDVNTDALLICELKWLLETDSIQEVCSRDIDIQKGITQAKLIQEYTEKDCNDLLNRAYGKNDYNPKTICTCVVTKNNIGTSRLDYSGIRVIDKDKLCEIFYKHNGNIEKVINEIKEGSYLKNINSDYKVEKKEIEYGENFFKFDACKLLGDSGIIHGDLKNKKNNKFKKHKRIISKKSRKMNRK